MHRRIARSLLLSIAAVALAACGGSDGPTEPRNPAGTGTVKGVVTAADAKTVIPGALVTLLGAPAGAPSATTDVNGAYTLNGVPAGAQTLVATRGVFRAEIPVTVQERATVTAPQAALEATGKLAYVAGDYDAIEVIVRDSLGNAVDEISASDLGNSAVTSQYKMIFLNCGLDTYGAFDAATVANLKAFIENGGIVYASDWAMNFAEALFPDDFLKTGSANEQIITASITDNSLQSFIGKASAEIAYDFGGWITLEQLSNRPTVLLRGSYEIYDPATFEPTIVQNMPLAVVLTHGLGKLVYTTFHNEAGVTEDQLAVLRYFIYLQ